MSRILSDKRTETAAESTEIDSAGRRNRMEVAEESIAPPAYPKLGKGFFSMTQKLSLMCGFDGGLDLGIYF